MNMVSTEQRKAPERISGSMNSVHVGKPVQVFVNRDIIKGEQIYSSYNMCEDCGGRRYSYGTPDILRDYGFVEQFPNLDLFRY